MQIANPNLNITDDKVILAAGLFDGIHLGHRAVLDYALRKSCECGASPWVLTFDRHPKEIFAPEAAPSLIYPLEKRIAVFKSLGFAGTLVIPFTEETAKQSPEVFAERLFESFPGLCEVVCGENWTFGAGARGNPALLSELGASYGFCSHVVSATHYAGKPISSTRIRNAIRYGRPEEAAAMLGSPYTIKEEVITGRQVGSANGIATANFQPDAHLLPKNGVYVVSSLIDGQSVKGIADIGFRPTFPNARPERPILEVHFLDYCGDLYGKELEISFIKFIRDEKKFDSPEELFKQINNDIDVARAAFL